MTTPTTPAAGELLTDDEVADLYMKWDGTRGASYADFIRATERALLAKLREQQPVGYLPAYELQRLASGHDGRLRTARFGPSQLDGDIALYAAPVPAQAVPWRPISEAPKDGRKLVLSYLNKSGKRRTVFGCWLTDEQAAETDGDDVGLTAGWYECIDNWDDFTRVAIHEGEPDFWQPLPAAPTPTPEGQS